MPSFGTDNNIAGEKTGKFYIFIRNSAREIKNFNLAFYVCAMAVTLYVGRDRTYQFVTRPSHSHKEPTGRKVRSNLNTKGPSV